MRSRKYFLILFWTFLLAPSALWVKDFVIDTVNIMRECTAKGRTADQYLAYCDGNYYGSYEHGAFYFNQEPEAVESLKQAEVIFLGNSRMQFAFSTQATENFFSHFSGKRPFYLLGFGFGEPFSFALAVMLKYSVHPKVIVVNADNHFFEQGMSPPAKKTVTDDQERFHNYLKKIKSHVQQFVCKNHPERCSIRGSIFRSRTTGIWNLENFRVNKLENFKVTRGGDQKLIKTYSKGLSEFMKGINVPASCVIFTTVPIPKVSPENAEILAKKSGAQFVETDDHSEEYETMDTAHLSRESAEKYSKSALPKFTEIFKRCGIDVGDLKLTSQN